MQVRVGVEGDATLRYGASLLAASWRDLGLDVRVASGTPMPSSHGGRRRSIPIARAVDARFVSPRVRGWREDPRGVVDYAPVTLRQVSRHSLRRMTGRASPSELDAETSTSARRP